MSDLSEEQICAALNFSVPKLRRWITLDITPTVGGSKGVKRAFSRRTLRRAARVAALNITLPLDVANAIDAMLLDEAEFDVFDSNINPPNGLAGWLDDDAIVRRVPTDRRVSIIDGYYVCVHAREQFPGEPASPASSLTRYALIDDGVLRTSAEYTTRRPIDPGERYKQLKFKLDPKFDHHAGKRLSNAPISDAEVNLGVACRIAVRKLLGKPIVYKESDNGGSR